MTVRFSVLGPVQAWSQGGEVPLGPPQQRAVLAILLLKHGQSISAHELVNGVWGESQPSGAVAVLRTYVSRLRKALEPDRAPGKPSRLVASVADGYRMCPEEFTLDLALFEARLGEARRRTDAGDLNGAAHLLHDALSGWNGTSLVGVPGPFAETERARLLQRWLSATEIRLSIDLTTGLPDAVVNELTLLRSRHPMRERLSELLMLALHRCGRTAEALGVFNSTRRNLVEELGIDPGPALRHLHDRILAADPALSTPAAALSPSGAALTRTHKGNAGPSDAESAHSRAAAPIEEAGEAMSATRSSSTGQHTVRPFHLPTDLPAFAGRATELGRVEALLSDSHRPATVVISGMAGIGKTALAVHWAHRIVRHFPDGTLFVNLRGFDAQGTPLDPADVIRLFLDALGVPPSQVPADPQAQVSLYRSLLADRRVLIVLDNARDTEQVRQLLPGTPSCLVLVTSRSQLQGLVARSGAHPLALGLMPPSEAKEVLIRRVGVARVTADSRAADDIVRLCGRLPLALAIVAARASMYPHFPLSAISADLRDSQGSLNVFSATDPSTDARSVFSWSYDALSPDAARMFRLLRLIPAPDIAVPMAASLAGITPHTARVLLANLARANLLMEITPGRYVFHDLLRSYAAELALKHDTPSEKLRAERRLLDHLLHSMLEVSSLLSPHRETIPLPPPQPGTKPERFTERKQALHWLRTERRTLCAAVARACNGPFPRRAWQLAFLMELFLDRLGHWHDSLVVHQTALIAAQRAGDLIGEAHARRGLGFACVRLDRPQEARQHLEVARILYAELQDDLGLARTLRYMAFQANRQGEHHYALHHYREASALYKTAGNRSGQGSVLNETGWTHILLEQYEQALDHCSQAILLHQETGDPNGAAAAHDSLGYAHHHLGNHAQAIACYRRALDLYRALGDRILEADTLAHIGDTECARGNSIGAKEAWQASAVILEAENHPAARTVRDNIRRLEQARAATGGGRQ
ncbi:AfsR/SARP family transcriptional regulator [Streptomyces sp. NBC_00271]|uniref:AfsR/SARP family transcriptional regulator n=1 Tax=Streptomyces sp. NBC_00271 TaxID=2975697 RepID=UPI002E27FA2A|nr:BTAD domain-containing putative transcriptional regulator [Streptomyces sp. NBC_00271]